MESKKPGWTIGKDSGKPRDYISLLQKAKKLIPGPDYEINTLFAKNGRFFIPKGNEPTYITTIMNISKKTPGIGKYETTGLK